MEPATWKLSQLCDEVQAVLGECLQPTYWVEAEISSLSDRGHCYLELVEKSENGLFAAKVRATCWQSTWRMLRAYFLEETGQQPAVGMQVLLEVSVDFHAVYGLSLNVRNINPTFTLGDLQRRRRETIERLEQEGMTERNRALVLPTLVRRLAVISSDTAAGYQDFVDQLMASGWRFSSALYPATMQGDGAEQSILAALDAIRSTAEEFDAVVIIRGGGATTDLSCFDGYALCRAVAEMSLPVLTGIGHTRDISILDMVAHTSLNTPTTVAAFLRDRMQQQAERVADLRRRLDQTAQRQVLLRRHRLEMLMQRVESCNPERIYRMGYSLMMANGKVVRSAAEVAHGTELQTYLADGVVRSVAQCE